jgi:hypothetical protein
MRVRIQQKRQLNKTFHLSEPFEVNIGRHNCRRLFTQRWFGCHAPTVTLDDESRTTLCTDGNHHGGTMRFTMAVVALALAILAGTGAVASAATSPQTNGTAAPAVGMPYN